MSCRRMQIVCCVSICAAEKGFDFQLYLQYFLYLQK
jgi:hypothetical protein